MTDKILVIGANGQIGQIFCQHAHINGINVRAMVRKPEQIAWFSSQGIDVVVADLEEDFSRAFVGCNQVVFTAGSGAETGADKTLMVDLYGAMLAVDLAKENNCRRFIMVSALRTENPRAAPEKLRPYMVAKKAADFYLQKSDLHWVVLRPGRLTNEPPSGKVCISASAIAQRKGADFSVSRENTAHFLLEIIQNRMLENIDIGLLDGDIPIASALQNFK